MTPAPMCPADCGRAIRAGRPFCPVCWAHVPQPLKREVDYCWRVVSQRGFGNDAALERYRKACNAALRAVR